MQHCKLQMSRSKSSRTTRCNEFNLLIVKLASLSGKASIEKGYRKSYFNATAAFFSGQ